MTDHVNDFLKCIDDINYGKRNYEVFQDFLTVSAISLTNIIYKNNDLEKEYLEVIKKYEKPEKLAELLAITVMALEEKTQDFLGAVYMRGNFGNKNSCQFFTPYHISQFMSECVFDKNNINKIIEEQGFIKISEPCCGAGGMILAFAETMLKNDLNPQKYMVFQGVDIDINCCRMSFIQTSLMGLTGEIIHGDTISLKNWQKFITPMTLLHMSNYKRFKEPTENKSKKEVIIQPKDYVQMKLL